MPDITIAMGNGHNEQALVDWMRDADAASFGAHEAQDLLKEFRAVPQHRVTVAGEDWGEERNRAKSTCIITASRYENLGEMTRKASERIPSNLRVAPDRVLVGSFYAHPAARAAGREGIAHFALHPNAAPVALRRNDPDHPIVREYREAMQTARRAMRFAEDDGLIPILTGDLQLPHDVVRSWSPMRMFVDQMNMGFVSRNIDWVLWPRRIMRLVPGSIRFRKLHDHVGIAVGLRPV